MLAHVLTNKEKNNNVSMSTHLYCTRVITIFFHFYVNVGRFLTID